MKKGVKRSKYYAPQNENKECKCDFPGCEKAGEFRAPKDRGLKEYYWFCLEHVEAYNAKWNYYADEFNNPEEEETAKAKMHFKSYRSRVNYQHGYKLKDDFEFFGQYASNFSSRQEVFYTAKEKKFIEIMELENKEISMALIKKQYKKLVKKYHPDLNQNDKKAEEKFKELTTAYHALLEKFS